jgi:hypothetical protein
MDKFSIILPNEKAGTYKTVTIIMAVINLIGFEYFSFSIHVAEDSQWHMLSTIGASVSLPPLIWFLFFKKARIQHLVFVIVSLFSASIIWMLIGFYLIAILLFLFAWTGLISIRKLKVEFSNLYIVYPTFPRKKIYWEDVSNLILKDNILTIDLKNNNLIQCNIMDAENGDLNEEAFNTFVQQRLHQVPL